MNENIFNNPNQYKVDLENNIIKKIVEQEN